MFEIRSGAESAVPRTGDHREPDIVIRLDRIQPLRKLPAELGVQRVHRLRAIQGDVRDVVAAFPKRGRSQRVSHGTSFSAASKVKS